MIIRQPEENVLQMFGNPVYLIKEAEVPDTEELKKALQKIADKLIGEKAATRTGDDDAEASEYVEKVLEWLIDDCDYDHFSVLEDESLILTDDDTDSCILLTGDEAASVMAVLKSILLKHRDAINRLLGER